MQFKWINSLALFTFTRPTPLRKGNLSYAVCLWSAKDKIRTGEVLSTWKNSFEDSDRLIKGASSLAAPFSTFFRTVYIGQLICHHWAPYSQCYDNHSVCRCYNLLLATFGYCPCVSALPTSHPSKSINNVHPHHASPFVLQSSCAAGTIGKGGGQYL